MMEFGKFPENTLKSIVFNERGTEKMGQYADNTHPAIGRISGFGQSGPIGLLKPVDTDLSAVSSCHCIVIRLS